MNEPVNPVRETDDDAIELAKKLVAEVKYASLAVNETGTGVPLVSRIAAGWSADTGLFFSGSDLSIHSKCLLEDRTCSLMIGEPGKGDGLAYPRITIIAKTKRMSNDDDKRARYRDVFLATHPKASLYVDFLDFGFYPLAVDRALLNGGFGKAYHLQKDDIKFLK